jgi:hypothetical protein
MVEAQGATPAIRKWGMRRPMALVGATVLIATAVYWIGFRPSEPCARCSRNTTYGIACGIEGATGIRWIDRVVDFIAGGNTYHWVGHKMQVTSNSCPDCHGTGGITHLGSWINSYKDATSTAHDSQ